MEPKVINEIETKEEIVVDVPPKGYSIKEYILFKIDRSIALFGIIGLAAISSQVSFAEGSPAPGIINNAMMLLGVYIGARSVK